jgi:ATP-dependent Clp protease ATP-binding subunit ClpB
MSRDGARAEPAYSAEFLDLITDAREEAERHTHSDVLPLHALWAIARGRHGLFRRLFGLLGTDLGEFQARIELALAALPSVEPPLGPLRLVEGHPLLQASRAEAVALRCSAVLSEHLLLAVLQLKDPVVRPLLEKAGIRLKNTLEAVLRLRSEAAEHVPPAESDEPAPTASGSALERYGRDLTALALAGRFDPVIGRDEEIRRILEVLGCRGKNNPLLVGEPGTGKTAVCEGLAQRIADRDVPEPFLGIRLIEIGLASLFARAAPGELEDRVRRLLAEAEASAGRVILMIDEFHALVRAPGGSMSPADLLKPALARGAVRVIGLTTQTEYRRHVEGDAALSRRFETVPVPEPSLADCVSMLRGVSRKYEVFHGLRITESAIQAAARLSARYLTGRFLPDKALHLLDRACSRAALDLLSLPAALDRERRLLLRRELEHVGLGQDPTAEGADARRALEKEIAELRKGHQERRRAWDQAQESFARRKALERRVADLRREQERDLSAGLVERTAGIRNELLPRAEKELAALAPGAGDDGDQLRDRHVAAEAARLTGVPVEAMLSAEDNQRFLSMEEALGRRVLGQRQAIAEVSRAVRQMVGGLKEGPQPIGSFLFLGPSGVGKTELAKALAQFLFGDERFLVRLDMSEFVDEKMGVSKLIGAGPGYVGYDEGGRLTEAVHRQPYSVILFDEVEKAHPAVFNTLLQIMEDGRITDGKGRTVPFANTLLVMTSNLGSEFLVQLTPENREQILAAVEQRVAQFFRPEFRGRLRASVVFEPLGPTELRGVLEIQLDRIAVLLADKHVILDGVSDAARAELVGRCTDPRFGARPLLRVLEREVRDRLARALLEGAARRDDRARIDFDQTAGFKLAVERPTP